MPSTLDATPDGRMPYFPALDGVRAVCVLLVMYNHLKTPLVRTRWINGHLGVDFFFLLSGFLITTLLLREQFFTGKLDLKAFYWRRFFRIIPVYLVVLGIYVVVCHLPGQALHWVELKSSLPWFLTLNNEYARGALSGNTFRHTWSIGVEEKFYLVWPLLFFLVARSLKVRVVLTAALLAGVLAIRSSGDGQIARAYFGLMAGSWLAVLLASRYAGRVMERVRQVPGIVILGCFFVGFALGSSVPDLIACFSAGAALLMVYLIAGTSSLGSLLAAKPMIWLGKRSYSMYLAHVLCLNAIETRVNMGRPVMAALALFGGYALAAGAGAVLYRVVEQPCREFGRRWLRRQGEVGAAV